MTSWSSSCRCDVAQAQFLKQLVVEHSSVRPAPHLVVGPDGLVKLISRQARTGVIRQGLVQEPVG